MSGVKKEVIEEILSNIEMSEKKIANFYKSIKNCKDAISEYEGQIEKYQEKISTWRLLIETLENN